jgi:hypothetical protein
MSPSGRKQRMTVVMIATGEAGRPSVGMALGAGEQVVGAELVEAAEADAQFEGDRFGHKQAGAGLSEEMANERSCKTVDELLGELEFFMARKVTGRWI